MEKIGKGVLIVLGGAVLALIVTVILALPGFVSDRESTVSGHAVQESRR